jgi:transposase InsO family protein
MAQRRRLPLPWKEICTVDERVRFIAAVKEDPRGNFSRLCERFGISRAKGYKWVARYNESGPAGLEDRRPVPHECPHRTPDAVVDVILELRKKHPFDGPKKLRAMMLAMAGDEIVPASSTIGDILGRHGLVRPRRTRLRVPPSTQPLEHAVEPNDLWCTDFKGHFALGDGTRCHPLTITDAMSRYLVKCEGLVQPRVVPVKEHFERAFREFGLPRGIRSDNGPPFASTAVGGLSELSVWWIQLGIVPERIEPGQPQQNGRHERFHRTLKEQTASPPLMTLSDQQRAFDRFRADYNDRRPHEALSQTPPSKHYEPSRRAMPDRPRPPEYDGDVSVRWVGRGGSVRWKGVTFYLAEVLANQPVGLHQTGEDEWELHYGPILLGYVLERGAKKIVFERAA